MLILVLITLTHFQGPESLGKKKVEFSHLECELTVHLLLWL